MEEKNLLNSKSFAARLSLGLALLLGTLFLIGEFFNRLFHVDIVHYGWPFLLILPGFVLFFSAFALERQAGLRRAILGGMVAMTGSILMLQNLTGLWASWSYAWTLIAPTSIGLAQLVYGALRGMPQQMQSGLNLTLAGMAVCLASGLFFELIIGVNGLNQIDFLPLRLLWPVAIISIGFLLLIVNLLPRRKTSGNNPVL